jgi:hypothetical protein
MQKVNEIIDLSTAFNDHAEMDVNEAYKLLRMSGMVFLSWGANDFTNIHNKALRFKSKGYLHKGHVYVCVDFRDEYNVILTDIKGKILSIHKGIYFEDLSSTIDELIERQKDYKF